MESLAELIGFITGFFDAIWTFITETITDVFKDFAEWLMVSLTVTWIETKIWLLEFSWSVASGVLDALDISSLVSSYVSQLSPGVAYMCSASGLFDGFNIIMQAYISSMLLKMMGW